MLCLDLGVLVDDEIQVAEQGGHLLSEWGKVGMAGQDVVFL